MIERAAAGAEVYRVPVPWRHQRALDEEASAIIKVKPQTLSPPAPRPPDLRKHGNFPAGPRSTPAKR